MAKNNNDISILATSEPQPSFLHGYSEDITKHHLPAQVRSLQDVDMVILHKQSETEDVVHIKVCDFAGETLFTSLSVKKSLQLNTTEKVNQLSNPKTTTNKDSPTSSDKHKTATKAANTSSSLGRQESFQYLVRRFESNDPLVVKPRSQMRGADVEICSPPGKTLGYCCKSVSEEFKFEIRDAMDSALYTLQATQPFCTCLAACRNNNKLEVRKAGEKKPISRVFLYKGQQQSHVITFPDNIDNVFKVLFIGSALAVLLEEV